MAREEAGAWQYLASWNGKFRFERLLAERPQAARERGGARSCTPILHLAYMRFAPLEQECHEVSPTHPSHVQEQGAGISFGNEDSAGRILRERSPAWEPELTTTSLPSA